MAISKEKKVELVAAYKEKFARSKAILWADYRGLNVSQMSDLRRRLREQDCEFMVAKNTLVKLALEEVNLPAPEALLEGPTAIGICYQDVVVPAKVLSDFAKEAEAFSIKGGILGQMELSGGDVVALGQLPSREVLLSQVVGDLEAPVSSLVRALNGLIQGLANVIKARAGQLEGASAF